MVDRLRCRLELAHHAAATYERAKAEGRSHEEALAQVEALIVSWRLQKSQLHRRPLRSPAPAPPPIGTSLFTGIVQDVRYAFRLLRREPGHAAVAVLTMALGIGVTTTLFSIAYGVLLKPLPWPEPDRLVRLEETRGGKRGRIPWTISNGTYLAWRDQPSTVEGIGGFRAVNSSMTLTGDGDADRVTVGALTPSLFTVLRARPAVGRLFLEAEAVGGQPSVIILGGQPIVRC